MFGCFNNLKLNNIKLSLLDLILAFFIDRDLVENLNEFN